MKRTLVGLTVALVVVVGAITGWAQTNLTKVSCTPDCKGKVCGPDGVGGSCGTCPENRYCDGKTGQCIESLFVNPDNADTFGGNPTPIDNALGLTIDNIVPLFSTIGANPNDPNDPTEVKGIPDQQTPILLQPDGSYHLFATGVALNLDPDSEEGHGCVSLLSTKDLTNSNAYSSKGIVLPSNCICPDNTLLSISTAVRILLESATTTPHTSGCCQFSPSKRV